MKNQGSQGAHFLRNYSCLFFLSFFAVCLSACSSSGENQRGWVGGSFKEVYEGKEPALTPTVLYGLPKESKASKGLFFLGAHKSTPICSSGLKQGDLILAVDEKPIRSQEAFQELVWEAEPGHVLKFNVWREGSEQEIEVVVGKETYQHSLSFGVSLSDLLGSTFFGNSYNIDPWPFDGDFNLLGVIQYKQVERYKDLRSHDYDLEYDYLEQLYPDQEIHVLNRRSFKEKRLQILPLTIRLEKQILKQETYSPDLEEGAELNQEPTITLSGGVFGKRKDSTLE